MNTKLTLLLFLTIILSLKWSEALSQEQSNVQSVRIVNATYPFDNFTNPKNLDLVIDDLDARVRSNSASYSNIAVSLELVVANCNESILSDTIVVEDLKPLRDTIVNFNFDEPLNLRNMVPHHCENFAFGGWPYGNIDYDLKYRVYQIQADQSWILQDSIIHQFAHYPKTFSKENISISELYRGASPNLVPFYGLSHHSVIFKMDSIPHYSDFENYEKAHVFNGVSIGLINLKEETSRVILLVNVFEYLGDEFDHDEFRQLSTEHISYHPLLKPLAISVIEETLPANFSDVFNISDWLDPIDLIPMPHYHDCLLKEGKTYVVSVEYEPSFFQEGVEIAFNQGIPTNHKAHSIFYNEDIDLHYNYSSPYQPVIRLHTLLKSGVCYEPISNTAEVVENIGEAVSIFPNPANELLKISINRNEEFNGLTIFSVNGKIATESPLDKSTLEHALDISHLSAGFYILELKGDKKTIRRPLIIKPF